MSKHTPTPWVVCKHDDNGEVVVRSVPDQGIVANCQCDSYAFDDQTNVDEAWAANAYLIVKCVNAHDELVAIVQEVAKGRVNITGAMFL